MARQEAKRRNKHEETDTMKEHHDSDGDDDISLSESPSRPDGRAEQEHRRLADVESKQICFWKTAVVGALVLAGTTVSLSVNMYLKNQQEKKIDQNFDLFAKTVEDVSQRSFESIFEAIEGFSKSLTSEALANEMTFPFVTSDNFEVYGQQARASSGVATFIYGNVVNQTNLEEWNVYSTQHKGWMAKSQELDKQLGGSETDYPESIPLLPFVYDVGFTPEGQITISPSTGEGRVVPLWQTTPPPVSPFLLNVNMMSIENERHPQRGTEIIQETILGDASTLVTEIAKALLGEERFLASHSHFPMSNQTDQPYLAIATPVFDSFDKSIRSHVGDIAGFFTLETFLVNLLPEGVRGVNIVVSNTCGQTFTFVLDGPQALYVGEGDLSDPDHHHRVRKVVFDSLYEDLGIHQEVPDSCIYSFNIYSSDDFEEIFSDDLPLIFALVITGIFLVVVLIFAVYDHLIRRRNNIVVTAAVRSTAIVDSLFPSNVRDRLYADNNEDMPRTTTARLKRFVDKEDQVTTHNESVEDSVLNSRPIADLFPETTVMFADIAGFTAWSSMRDPTQVFTLLETVYHAFDRIARQRRVFKVETVGDCYVAVAGCPNPVKNHAVVMSRFSMECLATMERLTKELEVTLGPDTGDLHMRIGLHSGPVTAGVLRGERARFQLFGDTMNTAARMESTGQKGRVQVSEETAELLAASGKKHWLVQRGEKVHAKGKGEMTTYFLEDEDHSTETKSITTSEQLPGPISQNMADLSLEKQGLDSKAERLVGWNVDVLWRLLKKVVARRIANGHGDSHVSSEEEESFEENTGSIIDEVQEIISLPRFDPSAQRNEPDEVQIKDVVKEELHNYVSSIASMYRQNPFHNFEHASHVTMSVVKLLSRIVAPAEGMDGNDMASSLHDHTYGITSDPLTQFACVLSALIHDCDHPGVPNAQLVKEQNRLAEFYNNQSIAEQNSVDLAWNLLMDPNYDNLRGAIYGTSEEFSRFRRLIVNSVMATDIVDKELKSLRNARWEKAFSSEAVLDSANEIDATNRKATIVIEHLIQASDVAHTMQHWHIYRKWNERFFTECFKAYKAGRGGDTNPADNWYKGELGFFDFYIIPLAKKLKECGVFGVSSDEYLNYAHKNRQEWEMRGQEIVAFMVEKINKGDGATLLLE